MFDGDTGIQSQRDTIIRHNSGNRLRDLACITLLWVLVFVLGFCCGVIAWVGPSERDIRDIVATEVPEQVRLILLP